MKISKSPEGSRPDREVVLERVISELEVFLGVPGDAFDEDTLLMEDCGLGSIDVVEYGVCLEDELDIVIQDEDFEGWRSIGDVVDFVEKALAGEV